MHHNVGDQDSAARDSTYVLNNLDAKNTKALNRRAFAARTNQKWDEAVRDYQELNRIVEGKQPQVTKDLSFCMNKYMENVKMSNAKGGAQKPAPSKPAPQAQKKGPVIQEMPERKPSDFKKVNIIEDDSSEDSDDLAEAEN